MARKTTTISEGVEAAQAINPSPAAAQAAESPSGAGAPVPAPDASSGSEGQGGTDTVQGEPKGGGAGALEGGPAAPTPEPEQPRTVTVIGPAKGRRRAGFTFNAAPQTVRVTEEQLAAIRADAALALSIGAPPAGSADPATGRLGVDAFLGPDGAVMPVTVIGPAKGRRRAGFSFGAEARTVRPSRAQLETILADPSLSVTAA